MSDDASNRIRKAWRADGDDIHDTRPLGALAAALAHGADLPAPAAGARASSRSSSATNGAGLNVAPAAPIETVQFEHTVLHRGKIELHLRNTSPEEITLAQVNINDAIWPFSVTPDATIPGSAPPPSRSTIPGSPARRTRSPSSPRSGIAFTTAIPVAAETPAAHRGTFWSFTLIGLYVGIIPVLLGMFWLPALRRLGPRAMLFLMAATVGLLIFLGIDAPPRRSRSAGDARRPVPGRGARRHRHRRHLPAAQRDRPAPAR